MTPLRILIADDHEIVRKGLRAILSAQPDWQICGEAGTGINAISLVLEQKPQIVIMDIHMPGLNGLDATKELLKHLPLTQVVILSAHESETLIRQMLASGARGYVLKADISDDLILAVETVAKGGLYFTSSISDFVLRESRQGGGQTLQAERRTQLTPRERDVLALLAAGKSNKEIGTALRISGRTVETHRANLMGKLNAHSLADLVRWAVQNELILP